MFGAEVALHTAMEVLGIDTSTMESAMVFSGVFEESVIDIIRKWTSCLTQKLLWVPQWKCFTLWIRDGISYGFVWCFHVSDWQCPSINCCVGIIVWLRGFS